VGVESNTHTVFIGDGGLWFIGNEFLVGVLSNPSSSFGFSTALTKFTMVPTSTYNTSNCSISGCVTIPLNSTWTGAGDPHANAVYENSSGDAKVLWMNKNFNYMAVVDLTKLLTNPGGAIWYQGVP